MLTKEEAKAKWCPFVRFHSTPSADSVPNRSENASDTTRCLGSGCMAWRWSDNGSEKSVAARFTSGKGYCGLAGKR